MSIVRERTSTTRIESGMKLAITGDSILNGVVRDIESERFHRLMDRIRGADVSLTHLETLIHDFDGPGVHPAAEAGYTWMRSPRSVLDELRWAGFDAVTFASNHTLDYSYGGMNSTMEALEDAGMPHCGAGVDLEHAAAPALITHEGFRIGVISMTSSFQPWARAGATRPDMKGRPGVNPLRFRYVASETKIDELRELWRSMGWWILQIASDEWWAHPAGLHNGVTKVRVGDVEGLTTDVDPLDLRRHVEHIERTRASCDLLVVHTHNHEWEPSEGMHAPAQFARQFARASVDAGADLFVAEGSHASLRGIEVHRGKPIFYDPGDLFRMSDNVPRFPHDFYERHHFKLDDLDSATVEQGIRARQESGYNDPENPEGGYFSGRVEGGMVPICHVGDNGGIREIELHPFSWSGPDDGITYSGLPLSIDGSEADQLFEYQSELSHEFGTTVQVRDGIGSVQP
jgi:poly-gamma-glutamate capsule biosynthesis protein CapA/YwtB (metallophosphatase superfamily)